MIQSVFAQLSSTRGMFLEALLWLMSSQNLFRCIMDAIWKSLFQLLGNSLLQTLGDLGIAGCVAY